MLRTVLGFALIGLAALVAGCGGGGGAGITATPPQASTMLPPELTGDWTVRNLGLPGDQLSVESDGQVVVPSSGTRGTVAIGECAPDGTLDLNGSWISGAESYSIHGTGRINPSAASLSMRATVLMGGAPVYEDTQVSGTKVSADYDAPPPPPEIDDSGDGFDTPPPPPTMGEDQSDGLDLPPPPPPLD